MSLLRPVESYARREMTVYRRAPGGPVAITRAAGSTVAVGADGRTIEVLADPFLAGDRLRDRLAAGVEVALDGEVVGVLRQSGHGVRRRERTIDFTSTAGDGQLPRSARFVARGVTGTLAMEVDGDVVIRVRVPAVLWLNRALRHRSGVRPEWVVLFAAVGIAVRPAALL